MVNEKPERYHLLGKLGTDLPIIESRSDEVSHSSASAAEVVPVVDRELVQRVKASKPAKVSTT